MGWSNQECSSALSVYEETLGEYFPTGIRGSEHATILTRKALLNTGSFGSLFIFACAFDTSYSSSRVSWARTPSAYISVQGTLKLYLRASMVYNSLTADNSVCGVFKLFGDLQ